MNYYKLSLDDKIGIAGIAIVNARRDPVIMEKIAVYGYGEEITCQAGQFQKPWLLLL